MLRTKFENRTKVLWGLYWLIGFTLMGFGVGLLLKLILPVTLISSGLGIVLMVIFLVCNKIYEIEHQQQNE